MNCKILIASIALTATIGVTAGPSVRWLDTHHRFGAFHEDDGTVECTFRYVNDGDAPLRITAARSSCGCTLPRYTRDDVAPGDTAEVVVSYDPTGRPGRFSKNVYIDTNTDPVRTTLTISGTVIGAPATVAQRYPVELGDAMRLSRGAVMAGDVAKGHMKSVFVEVYNASTDTLRPVATSVPPFVDLAWMPAAVAPGEQTSLVCHVRTDKADWGFVADSIVIAPDAASAERHTLPLTVVVSEDFSGLTDELRAKAPVADADPASLDFGTLVCDGNTATLTAEIRNRGRRPLEIRRVYCVDAGVSATIDRTRIKPGKSGRLTVTVDPSQLAGRLLNSKVNIICNDPTRPNLAVRAVGQLKNKP